MASNATLVQVDESDYKIVSSITTFTSGAAYRFVAKNNGNATHEFMIMPKPEGTMSEMTMEKMDTMALAKVENIAPGQAATPRPERT